MRADTSKPRASAVRNAAPSKCSRWHTASAAGSTVPLACDPVSGSHSNAPIRTPLAKAALETSVRQSSWMTEASGGPPSAWTTDTIRRLHGWTDPTKPAAIASSTAILQLSTRPFGKSANRVSTTKRASVRVSFIGGSGPPHSREDFFRQHVQLVEGEALRHARPLHTHDQVVDPGLLVQPEDLPGDFIRRSQQEPVADQLVEFDAEIVVALGHHLVLAPLLIGAILRAEVWRAEPDCLVARARHEHLAPRGKLLRERPAAFIERALVDVDLPHDRVDAVVRVHVPAVTQTCRATNGGVGVGADPHGRMRLLHRPGSDRRAGEGEVRALHVDDVL